MIKVDDLRSYYLLSKCPLRDNLAVGNVTFCIHIFLLLIFFLFLSYSFFFFFFSMVFRDSVYPRFV